MDYHPCAKEIENFLLRHKVAFEFFEHAPVRTSEEAASARPGYSLEQGAKAILARVKNHAGGKIFAMFVVPGNKRLSMEKAKALLGATDIRFANDEEVAKITGGIESGGIPPFGNLFDVPVIADTSLFDNGRIIFNAGDRRCSIAIESGDYRRVVQPKVEDICE